MEVLAQDLENLPQAVIARLQEIRKIDLETHRLLDEVRAEEAQLWEDLQPQAAAKKARNSLFVAEQDGELTKTTLIETADTAEAKPAAVTTTTTTITTKLDELISAQCNESDLQFVQRLDRIHKKRLLAQQRLDFQVSAIQSIYNFLDSKVNYVYAATKPVQCLFQYTGEVDLS
jgi:hypothetical protein